MLNRLSQAGLNQRERMIRQILEKGCTPDQIKNWMEDPIKRSLINALAENMAEDDLTASPQAAPQPAPSTIKIKVRQVELTRAEGSYAPGTHLGETLRTPNLKYMDRHIHGMAATAPEGGAYDKCDVKVIFADGFSYSFRFDMQRKHRYEHNILRGEMFSSWRFHAGRYCPSHLTEAEYKRIALDDPERVATFQHFLDTYELD